MNVTMLWYQVSYVFLEFRVPAIADLWMQLYTKDTEKMCNHVCLIFFGSNLMLSEGHASVVQDYLLNIYRCLGL
jgi:hypothetical protein